MTGVFWLGSWLYLDGAQAQEVEVSGRALPVVGEFHRNLAFEKRWAWLRSRLSSTGPVIDLLPTDTLIDLRTRTSIHGRHHETEYENSANEHEQSG
jgi:hypothetical protein